MQDHSIGMPACFTSTERLSNDHNDQAAVTVTRSGQSVFMSTYRTKIADQCRLVTVTWCKNMLLHGLSISLQGYEGDQSQCTCKVELKPWYFWRKQGSKRFMVDSNKAVDVFWDLKAAKFNGETEPISEYYVAIVSDEEVVLLLGDLRKDAYRKTGCRPSLVDPILVSRKEHIFGKRKFSTRVKFHEKGRVHEISIEYKNVNNGDDQEMQVSIDNNLVIQVKHLQWKFRGNECISLHKYKVEVYWDVHDWLFSPGLRHGLFIFKPVLANVSSSTPSPSTPLSLQVSSSGSQEGFSGDGGSDFCLFLYAWKVE